MGLRGRLAVLSEGYSNADFKTRVSATYNFVVEVLSLAVEQRATVKSLVQASNRWRPDSSRSARCWRPRPSAGHRGDHQACRRRSGRICSAPAHRSVP